MSIAVGPIKARTARIRLGVIICLSLLTMAPTLSCGIGVRARALFGEKLDIKVAVSEQANQNSPVAVDVIVVYDEALLSQLLKLSSREWFDRREQVKRDYLEGTGLDYWGWEWVPGQLVPTISLPFKAKAKGGLIFANYSTPGPHRYRIDPFKDIKIHLLDKDFHIELWE